MIIRPCFLVVDKEHSGSISTRKLVIEAAKFNVITAYSGAEAVETLRKFPALDGVVLDAGIEDLTCHEVLRVSGKSTRPFPSWSLALSDMISVPVPITIWKPLIQVTC